MRKLFARVSESVTGSRRELDSVSSSSTNSTRALSGDSSEDNRRRDLVAEQISNAAQALSDVVQEILSNTASLQENLSGFHRLLVVSDITCDDSISSERGVGSLDILLSNQKHPLFVEKCNEIELATALMHALRLLRMYEIKLAKGRNINVHTIENRERSMTRTQGVTFTASKRLCAVISALMSGWG